MLLSNVDRPNWTSVSSTAMSRSNLKLKLQNQISIFTTIKTYLEKKRHYIIFSVNVSPTGDRTAIFIQSHLSHVMVF